MSVENSLAQRVAEVSPSSILSLPNDLLHPIMQEAYHTSQPPPRRHSISEIIVNKRIFAVARPIWISHLVISEPQADQQFSALEDDELRCQSLQHLEVKVEDFSHLSDVVLSRQFPKLAKLTIHFPYETKKVPAWAIGKVVSRIGNLRHLEVHLNRNKPSEARELIETTLNFPPLLVLSWFLGDDELLSHIGPTFRVESQAPRDMSASTWARLASFELRPFPFLRSNIDGLLDSLESALNGSSGEVPTIPLRRLSLRLGADGEGAHARLDCLRSSAFNRLLRLLPSAAVDRLEFTANSIPAISEDVPLVQSDQTSSMNRVQQENAEGGDALQVQPRAGSPQVGTTSLLSLPDDLLLMVYEELYEDQYGGEMISPPISEILINKRLYKLARPLWISRLSICSSQLDQRLVGLLDDSNRRTSLRKLDLQYHESHAHLIRITLSRLTSLVEVRIRISVTPSPFFKQTVFQGIQEGGSVTNVEFHLDSSIMSQVPEIWQDVQWQDVQKETRHQTKCLGIRTPRHHVQRRVLHNSKDVLLLNLNFVPSAEHIHSFRSFEYRLHPNPCADELLQCFEETVAQDPIERLEFDSLNWIPLISEQHHVKSLKLLKLSGTCSFAEEDNFRNFSSLLLTLPSLTHLHLIGSHFFSDNLKADDISKIDDFTTSFRYPCISALLFVLRTTEIKVFTFRGEDEKREMRWTRISKNDEFNRDCWTL
ncbi:hypothetical protein JCM5350_004339 [Sporobolomyces pararoseus]